MNQKVIFEVLDNGLNLVIAPRENTDVVAIWIFAHGGSDYENKENNGIHHFLEHMYFKGTEKRPKPKDIWKTVEGRGGTMNAQTYRDIVGCGIVMHCKNLKLGLEVSADILFNSHFDPKEIEKEKGVIIQEKRRSQENPMDEIYDDLWDGYLYPNCSWGFPIEGPEENIRTMTQKQLISCMRKHYCANSMVISVAGRVDPDETVKLVGRYFSRVKRGERLIKPRGIEEQNSPQVFLRHKRTKQTHLILGVRGYHLFHPLKCGFELLGIILGGNSGSRLFTLVRGEKGLAYAIHTHTNLYADRGVLATYAGVDHDNVFEAVQLIFQEYKKALRGEITEEELKLAKEYTLGEMARNFEDSENLAAFLGIKRLFKDPLSTPAQEMEAVERVTIDDIHYVAQDIFKDEKLNLVILGPHRDKKNLKKILRF